MYLRKKESLLYLPEDLTAILYAYYTVLSPSLSLSVSHVFIVNCVLNSDDAKNG